VPERGAQAPTRASGVPRDAGLFARLVDHDDAFDWAALYQSDRFVAPGDDLDAAALATLARRCRPGETSIRDREAGQRDHVLRRARDVPELPSCGIDMEEAEPSDRRVAGIGQPDAEPCSGLIPAGIELRDGLIRNDLARGAAVRTDARGQGADDELALGRGERQPGPAAS